MSTCMCIDCDEYLSKIYFRHNELVAEGLLVSTVEIAMTIGGTICADTYSPFIISLSFSNIEENIVFIILLCLTFTGLKLYLLSKNC